MAEVIDAPAFKSVQEGQRKHTGQGVNLTIPVIALVVTVGLGFLLIGTLLAGYYGFVWDGKYVNQYGEKCGPTIFEMQAANSRLWIGLVCMLIGAAASIFGVLLLVKEVREGKISW